MTSRGDDNHSNNPGSSMSGGDGLSHKFNSLGLGGNSSGGNNSGGGNSNNNNNNYESGGSGSGGGIWGPK